MSQTQNNIIYDINCFGCGQTKTIESEVAPSEVKHFVTIAAAVGWKFLVDEENQRLLYSCSDECLAANQNKDGSLKK